MPRSRAKNVGSLFIPTMQQPIESQNSGMLCGIGTTIEPVHFRGFSNARIASTHPEAVLLRQKKVVHKNKEKRELFQNTCLVNTRRFSFQLTRSRLLKLSGEAKQLSLEDEKEKGVGSST